MLPVRMESDDSILEKVRKMNTRSIALIAVLAVAAVAIVGAGYAYWGQTQVDDNTVDSDYIAVVLTEASGGDYTPITQTIEYNTTYAYNTTTSKDEYMIAPQGYTAGFDTTIAGKNLVPIKFTTSGTGEDEKKVADSYEMMLKSSKSMNEGSYTLTLTLTDVTLGAAGTLYCTIADSITAETKLVAFTASGTTYTATIENGDVKAPAITTADVPGYKSSTVKVWLFLDISGTASAVEGVNNVTIDNVNKAQCIIGSTTENDGILTFKATVTPAP